MTINEILDTMDYGKAPEDSAPALKWLEEQEWTIRSFIDGELLSVAEDGFFNTVNPGTGEVLARVQPASTKDVDKAVKAARKAQKSWAALRGHERAKYLYAIARLVQKHSRLLAVLETLDNGKPIRESRDIDVPLVARHFYHHAGWAQLMERELPNMESVGVVGQVIPWNFPLLMLAWKIAPALAMGNTVVLKPAELTPVTAMLFSQICAEAGLPKGVVNIVMGDGAIGAALTEHKDVDKVAFTGSTDVGRIIRSRIAGSGKKLTLELGGKSPFIIFDDADIDSAVEGIVDAIWFNQGQVCCAGSRLLVHEPVAQKLYDKLRYRIENLRVGDPLDKSTDIGAIIDKNQLEQITTLVQYGIDDGAEPIRPSGELPKEGFFFPPTLLTNVDTASKLAQDEIFGPVLVSMTFRTPAEAVQLANNTRYGLAASVWTENINLAMDMAPKIKAGVVWVNCTNQLDAAAGFGGMRESGFGREGGKEGLYEYVKPTYLKSLQLIKALDMKEKTGVVEASVDRTAKLYIGGKQSRPDSGYAREVLDTKGKLIGHVGEGNRKDIRNAVEAANKAANWAKTTGHLRAQILYYIGENLSARASEFEERIRSMTGVTAKTATQEVATSIDRLFTYAAWADKYDGNVHSVPIRGVALAMREAVGNLGLLCPDENPLLAFTSMIAPAIAMGNRVIIVPSSISPLAATDLYQVFDTSDLPAGVVNIVTGDRNVLAKTLAEHADIDGLWYHGDKNGCKLVEDAAAHNMKRTWVNNGLAIDWLDEAQGASEEFLRHSTEIKNVWVPYGE
ncbi:aldehyde dehydrogenase family protein [Lentilitoribacter sp. EG35]|uniref:aldehyde dehydrogenase family protein n=1 Tax=Lentilitoribacter sp. EG35 TaxID=3234192 RepID=UPI003461322B